MRRKSSSRAQARTSIRRSSTRSSRRSARASSKCQRSSCRQASMRSVDVLIPDDIEEAVPFSVRLAERRMQQPIVSRSDRRAHARRPVSDLNWLRFARLAKGDDVQLVDLSEGGALLELESPLKPGTILSLEIAGRDLDLTVPFEVLRCYVSRLRGDVTIYRGACVFAHLIELPKPVVRGATLRERPAPHLG